MKTKLSPKFWLSHPMDIRWIICALLVITLMFIASVTQAQLGGGWVSYSPTKKIHLDDEAGLQTFTWTSYKSVCSNPICADYRYDAGTNIETFQIFDSRSNRSEIRLQNEYSSGSRQFEGYVTITAPLEDESLFQIFGSTSGATQLMIRGFAANNGTISGGGASISNIYDKEVRVNVIHLQEDVGNKMLIYFNGVKAGEIADNEAVTNYQKYGCYGTTNGNVPAIVKWRSVRVFRDGTAPSGSTPSAPTSLTASAVSSSQINLNWSDNSSNESNFSIERSTNGGTSWSVLTSVGANTTTYANTGLAASTTYHYRVRATNASGNSGYSNTANATTQGIPVQPTYQAENAEISQGVVESNHVGFNGTGFVNYDNVVGSYVEWDINVANAGTYNLAIRYANGSGVDRPLSITVNGATTHTSLSFPITAAWTSYTTVAFTAALNAGVNTLRATATTAGGGPNVDELQVNGMVVTPPAAPSSLSASVASASQINLTWVDNSSNEANFRIERSTDGGTTWTFLSNAGTNVTTFSNTGLTQSTTYHYRVRAENAGGNSAFSNTASATTSGTLQNVALNKPVTASGSDANVPANAVDGDNLTRWSASPMPQWLEVDLGAVYSISKTEVVSYQDRAYQFLVEAKTTSTGTYSTVVDRRTNTTPGTITAPITNTFTAVNARYVRITVTGASGYTGTWASILEFRVFGVPTSGGRIAPERTDDTEITTNEMKVTSYPNPSTDKVKIQFSLRSEGAVKLSVHNTVTNKVIEVLNENLKAGVHHTTFDATQLPKGIHVIRLSQGRKVTTYKLIKQ